LPQPVPPIYQYAIAKPSFRPTFIFPQELVIYTVIRGAKATHCRFTGTIHDTGMLIAEIADRAFIGLTVRRDKLARDKSYFNFF
jgi:hypothetical protein